MVLVTCPKFPLGGARQQVPFGGPNCGWLKRLKNSVRNSIAALSAMVVFLKMAKSKFLRAILAQGGVHSRLVTESVVTGRSEAGSVEPLGEPGGRAARGALIAALDVVRTQSSDTQSKG